MKTRKKYRSLLLAALLCLSLAACGNQDALCKVLWKIRKRGQLS